MRISYTQSISAVGVGVSSTPAKNDKAQHDQRSGRRLRHDDQRQPTAEWGSRLARVEFQTEYDDAVSIERPERNGA